jgi:exodeoxyribonuclease VII large subunit
VRYGKGVAAIFTSALLARSLIAQLVRQPAQADGPKADGRGYAAAVAKVEPILYGERKVYTVSAFNRGIATYLARLPALWVEGEISEQRRNEAWATVFLTLKDPKTGATLKVTIPRRTFDRLALRLEEGETVHVAGRAELYEQKGELGLRATTIERIGLGAHLLALERLKRQLAAEGLFAPERKRRLPRFPRAIGVLTGADAAARGDLVATIGSRFPPAKLVVCETRVQGKGAPAAIVAALGVLNAHPEVDVVVLARGGGSFEDLLPFSDEAVVRAVAASAAPVVSAVGHEQDAPLCDLAADVRAATPTAAGALVVPELTELHSALDGSRRRATLAVRAVLERQTDRLERLRERLGGAPRLLLERRRAALDRSGARLQALSPLATLDRGYAIVRSGAGAIRDSAVVAPGDRLEIQLAAGSLAATVDEVRP